MSVYFVQLKTIQMKPSKTTWAVVSITASKIPIEIHSRTTAEGVRGKMKNTINIATKRILAN